MYWGFTPDDDDGYIVRIIQFEVKSLMYYVKLMDKEHAPASFFWITIENKRPRNEGAAVMNKLRDSITGYLSTASSLRLPVRMLVIPGIIGQVDRVASVSIHHINFPIAVAVRLESNQLAIGRPGRGPFVCRSIR